MGTAHKGSPSGPSALVKTSVSVVVGTVNAATVSRVTAALAALRATDLVVVNPRSTLTANVGFAGARVSAAGVIEVALVNPTVGALTPATQVFDVVIQRFTS